MSKIKSNVWTYFVQKNKDEAQCTKCQKIMKSSGGSTTSLILHLMKIHQIEIKQDADEPSMKKVRTLEFFLEKKSMEAEISKLAALDGFSFNSIAKSDFIQTSLHLRKSEYDKGPPTSSNGVKDMVMNFYVNKKNELFCYFKKQIALGIRYSLTLDEYTSMQNKRYMNINVQARDRHWSLGLIEINGSLDSRKTEQIVRRHLLEFGLSLDEHIAGCTTDGASVMVKFGKDIKPAHQQCIAHCIHLSVIDTLYKKNTVHVPTVEETNTENEESDTQDDDDYKPEEKQQDMIFQTDLEHETVDFPKPIQEIAECLNKVRKISKLFRKSPTKNEILQDFVRANFQGKEYKLMLDCKTRWNSMFYMIERFLKLKSCIPNALRAVLSTESVSDDEWQTLDLIYATLRPVELILKAICAEDIDLLKAESSIEFLLGKLKGVTNPLALKLYQSLSNRYNLRRNAETVALTSYLHDPAMFTEESNSRAFPFPAKQVLKKYAERTYKRLFPEHPEIEETNEEVVLQTNVASTSSVSEGDDQLMIEYDRVMKKLNEELKTDTIDFDISKEFKYFESTLKRSEKLEKLYKSLLTI